LPSELALKASFVCISYSLGFCFTFDILIQRDKTFNEVAISNRPYF
jgi:hypothetical protein